MLRKLIAFAITSGLAKKAWEHYREGRQAPRANVNDMEGKPASRRKGRARKSAPSA
jgi:hypothetical protein